MRPQVWGNQTTRGSEGSLPSQDERETWWKLAERRLYLIELHESDGVSGALTSDTLRQQQYRLLQKINGILKTEAAQCACKMEIQKNAPR